MARRTGDSNKMLQVNQIPPSRNANAKTIALVMLQEFIIQPHPATSTHEIQAQTRPTRPAGQAPRTPRNHRNSPRVSARSHPQKL